MTGPGVACLHVCIPHTGRDGFDYLATDPRPAIGARVWVPFRNKTRLGIVLAYGVNDSHTLKPVTEVIDEEAVLDESLLSLARWVSRYYQSPLSEVIPLMLPKNLRHGAMTQLPYRSCYQLAKPLPEALSMIGKRAGKQQALATHLAGHPAPLTRKQLREAGFGKAHIDALDALGLLHILEEPDLPVYHNGPLSGPLALNEEQALAVEHIADRLHEHHCFLLQGVTGSGKTEVYLHLIARVLAANRQVLVLVPEIGLTPQLLSRFSQRFCEPMLVIHSQLNDGERALAWQAARENKARLIIGTRSAVFTPLAHPGLIIIDEEHDASLKQMDGVRYSARDSALIRAQQAGIPVVLGSATPSLESLYNCQQKKYTRLRLRQKAMLSTPLHYQVIDLRNQPIREGLAPPGLERIREHVERGNQVLVFINRRGFAPVLLCHHCGWMVDCHACDSHLTMHRQTRRLNCHHCGQSQGIPAACRSCGGRELIPVGTGTQRIHEYLQSSFPEHTVLRIDRDEVRRKNELDARLDQIHRGEAHIIVGTQMLAKGHHFPRLTLVVLVDIDQGFYNQDFRSIEQLGQLLVQVAGRAGRAEHPGQVVIQTHVPQHPLLNTLIQQGYDPFADQLLEARQQAALPPYQYLAVIRAEDKDAGKITRLLQQTKSWLGTHPVKVLGPAPAPLARKAHLFRMQLLIKSASRKQLHHTLTGMRNWLTMNKQHNGVRWNIDVDPQDLS